LGFVGVVTLTDQIQDNASHRRIFLKLIDAHGTHIGSSQWNALRMVAHQRIRKSMTSRSGSLSCVKAEPPAWCNDREIYSRWCGRRFHLAENGEAAGRGLGLPCARSDGRDQERDPENEQRTGTTGSRQGLDSVLQQIALTP